MTWPVEMGCACLLVQLKGAGVGWVHVHVMCELRQAASSFIKIKAIFHKLCVDDKCKCS